ncbi:hypothetical protein TanjilG_20930 [Lupinus angustifolius]|uniref:Uncharacterized protein n=1 Tax=Lupinus angustifolius TaxID=3871 RepID=A0A1J7GVS1_LUPAN|nr:PREDICTED: uncharacterized protein LOC109355995 [Lupinus angustifolius]OIW04574.1 hypothetical protein TanjilG_20930 [Lupinus angustifolius]
MKTEQHNKKLSSSKAIILSIAKPAAYFILLLLTYTLGYLSAPSSPTSSVSSLSPSHVSSTISRVSNYTSTELKSFRVTTQCSDPIPPEKIRQTVIDRVFDGTSPFHNFPPEHAVAILKRTPKVKGWGSNGAVFENLIRKVKPRIIVEVGTFLGASAIHMAELTHRFGLKTQILCIDDFRGWTGFREQFKNIAMLNGDVLLYYQFLQNVAFFNHTGSVLPLPFSSGSALATLCEWGVFADLVEIDAGHDFLSAWVDVNRGFRILRPGGVIFGHDYFTGADNKGVRRAVDLFAQIHNLKVRVDGQHWVIHTT